MNLDTKPASKGAGFGRHLWRVLTIFAGVVVVVALAATVFRMGSDLNFLEFFAVTCVFTGVSFSISAGISYAFTGRIW